MEQYISKSAVVAEIEKRLKEYRTFPDYQTDSNYMELCEILSFINTLEVKEVDLEKEIDKEIETRWRGEYLFTSKFRESAKHFFELGLKTQKGE